MLISHVPAVHSPVFLLHIEISLKTDPRGAFHRADRGIFFWKVKQMDHINRLMEKAAKARAVACFICWVKHRKRIPIRILRLYPPEKLSPQKKLTKKYLNQLSNEKTTGCLGYIGGYTTQFYRDYNKP